MSTTEPGSDPSPDEVPRLSPRLLVATAAAEVTPRRAELRRVASATRDLIEGLVGTDADDATVSAAADELERIAARFHTDVPRSIYDGVGETALAGHDGAGFFDHSPLIGRANPLSPPVTLTLEDDLVVGTVTFGSAYEGPPGCVHGGYVAAAFDEVLGSAQTFSGAPGMTGTLTIRYRNPTPLSVPLRIEGRFSHQERRKVFTTGRMYAGDVLTAEAEGIFISIGVERFRALRAERDERLDPNHGLPPD